MKWGQELQARSSAWEQDNQSSATAAPVKRTASGSGDLPERGVKRAKTVDADDVMSDEAMRKVFDKNEVAKVSIQFFVYRRILGLRSVIYHTYVT